VERSDFQHLASNFLLDPLEAALVYRELGLSVVPIKAGTKRMATDLCYPQCFERLPTADEVRSWWQTMPDAQVGIALGVNGLRCIDFERRGEFKRFQHILHRLVRSIERRDQIERDAYDLLGTVSKMPKARSWQGFHLYFRFQGNWGNWSPEYKDLAWLDRESVVNALFHRRYMVAPPSIYPFVDEQGEHYGQERYGWWWGHGLLDIPELSQQQFDALLWACSLVGDGDHGDYGPYDVNYEEWD
jgi:hypothetical protein